MNRSTRSPRPWQRTARLMLFAGLFGFVLFASLLLLTTVGPLARGGEEATATVVELRTGGGQRTGAGSAAALTVAWTDARGTTHRAQTNTITLWPGIGMSTIGPAAVTDLEVGDTVSVTYDPERPARVYLTAYAGAGGVLGAAGGVLLGAGGLWFCLRRLLRRRPRSAPAAAIQRA